MTRRRVMHWMVVAALTCVAAAGHRTDPQRDEPATAAESASETAGASIYALDLSLVDDGGRSLRLADLRGQTIVAAMMYTTCTSVCPRVTEDMKVIERRLSASDKHGVTFALFSLDPSRDTSEALRRFASEHQLTASQWRLFALSEDGVRDLAAVLGVKYRREDDEISHSAMIFVIDREGVVRHRQLGLNGDQRALVEALARAR